MNLNSFRSILRRALFIPILGLVALAAIFAFQILHLRTITARVDAHDRTLTRTSRLLRHAVDAETGLRGYQATGDALFLEPYNNSVDTMPGDFASLRAAVAGDAEQRANIDAAAHAWQDWLAFSRRVIVGSRSGTDVRDVDLNRQGKALMDNFRARIAITVTTEEQRRDEDFREAQQSTHRVIVATILITLVLGIAIGLYTRREMLLISTAFDEALRAEAARAAALAESERWLFTMLRSIGDAVISCDADGNVRFMNPVAEQLCGWTSAEAHGLPLTQIFNILNEHTRARVENPVDKVKRLNTVVGLANHTVLLSRTGAEYNIDDSGAPIRLANGEIAGIVLVFRDITEQKRAEQSVIANEKLAVAGRLAASIAHEIHNPLDSVANLLFLMEQDGADNGGYVKMAREELGRVTQISRAMLSIYRESRTPVPTDLKELVENVLILLDRKLQDNLMQVKLELEPVTVTCYPSEIRQVLINLVSNATEASSKGGEVKVRITAVDQNSLTALPMGGARIEIADHGSGIPQDVLQRLFTPFFTTKGEHGTGLGLWISRNMVEKHGGTILVNSNTESQRHGTTFAILLPAQALVPNEIVRVQ